MSQSIPRLNAQGVTIYSKSACKFCVLAKEFFDRHKIGYTIVYLNREENNEEYDQIVDALLSQSSQQSFPFIFIGESFLGGYTELENAYNTLRLHEMLASVGITLLMDF